MDDEGDVEAQVEVEAFYRQRNASVLKVGIGAVVIGLLGQIATADDVDAPVIWDVLTGAGLLVSAIALVLITVHYVQNRY